MLGFGLLVGERLTWEVGEGDVGIAQKEGRALVVCAINGAMG